MTKEMMQTEIAVLRRQVADLEGRPFNLLQFTLRLTFQLAYWFMIITMFWMLIRVLYLT